MYLNSTFPMRVLFPLGDGRNSLKFNMLHKINVSHIIYSSFKLVIIIIKIMFL